MDLAGTTAVVTGGGKRVGRAIALAFAERGVNLVIHYNTSAAGAEETAAVAVESGVTTVTVGADLGDADAPARIFDAATELGPVQLLVNSASLFPHDSLLDMERAGWEKTVAVTLTAPLFLCREFGRRLPADLQGAIVNVTDWRTARPYPDHVGYTVAKGGVDALTRAAAVALAPRVRVNAVALGAVLPPPGEDSRYLQELAGRIPLQRVGGVEPVQEAVIYLAEADFVTGEILRINGGAHLS